MYRYKSLLNYIAHTKCAGLLSSEFIKVWFIIIVDSSIEHLVGLGSVKKFVGKVQVLHLISYRTLQTYDPYGAANLKYMGISNLLANIKLVNVVLSGTVGGSTTYEYFNTLPTKACNIATLKYFKKSKPHWARSIQLTIRCKETKYFLCRVCETKSALVELQDRRRKF